MPQVTWNGITFNLVTVVGQFLTLAASPAPASGSLTFTPNDLCWSTTYAMTGHLPTVGVTLDSTGSFSVPLLAMDNAGLSSNWNWLVSGSISGFTFPSRKLTITYVNGDSQRFETLLNSSTPGF